MADHESTMKWKVDISQLKAAMQEAKRSISLANAEFKTATAGMDKWQNSATGLEAKMKQLKTVLENQTKILADQQKQYKLTAENLGENSSEAQKLKIQIENQKAAINKTVAQLQTYNGKLTEMKKEQAESSSKFGELTSKIKQQESQLADLKDEYAKAVINFGKNSKEAKSLAKEIESLSGDLADNKAKMDKAKKSADNFDKSLDDVGDSARDAEGGFTVMKGALADLVADGIEKALDGLKKLGEKIIEVGKQSIANYASYEQLVGGVETLFKESAGIVEEYANNAFKTAGLSANEYMETVTSFSASLLQGLGGDTEQAAKLADLAITDMSDNANKMGTSMDLIQNAYQGFAKNNFTMLDNLKLGYGGTQTEMIRLINDSGILNKEIKKIDEVSFDQMILAIHKIQNEMGITGTTSKEAADTIEGSKNSMMASWSNLLTEFAKSDGDVEGAFNTFADSVITYAQNMLPRIEELVDNVIEFARGKLEEKAPELLEFIDTITEGLKTVGDMISEAFTWIIDNGDTIIATIAGIATAIGAYLAYTTAMKIMTEGWTALTIVTKAQAAAQAALNLVMSLNPIGLVIAAIAGLVAAFVVLWNKSEGFRNFWIELWEKIKESASAAWEKITTFFSEAWDKIKEVWGKVTDFFSGLWEDIKSIFSTIAEWIDTNVFQPIIEFFEPVITFFQEAWAIIEELAKGAWIAIKAVWSVVSNWFKIKIINPIKNFFSDLWALVKMKAGDAWDSIKSTWTKVSTWFEDNIITPVSDFFTDMWDKLKSGASDAWTGIKTVFGKVADFFEEKFGKAWEKVKGVFSTGGEIFGGIKEGIEKAFKTVVNAIIRGINKVVAIPFNAINKSLDKIRDVSFLGISPFKNLISRFTVPQIPELARGGVLKRGQMGFLEGNGAEAVVPLEKNKEWIAKVAAELLDKLDVDGVKKAIDVNVNLMNGTGILSGLSHEGSMTKTQNVTFNQTINSPKAVDRLTLYRETNSLLFSAKVRLGNV